jgi:hypothetical protein
MRALLWPLWLRLSGQPRPTFRGHQVRNVRGAVYAYAPEEMTPAWTLDGKFVNYGAWPPLFGGK